VAPVLLLDGSSLAYRAFYALPSEMATSGGQTTNAVVGFGTMLANLVATHRPAGVAACFDLAGPTFRHEEREAYKAGRPEMPDSLREQFGLIRRLLELLDIPTPEVSGLEADDILATLATRLAAAGEDVWIVTGDRDAFQLVEDPHIRVLYNRRGVSDYVLYDEAGIEARYGVPPARYPDLAAFRGDPSDNLPGVPGIGEKTAARLLGTYGTVEGVLAHLDELSPRLRDLIAAHRDDLLQGLQLTRLVRDAPVEVTKEELALGGGDLEELRSFCQLLEMRQVFDRLRRAFDEAGAPWATTGGRASSDPTTPPCPKVVPASDLPGGLSGMLDALVPGGALVCEAAWSGDAGRSPLRSIALVQLDSKGRPRGWLTPGSSGAADRPPEVSGDPESPGASGSDPEEVLVVVGDPSGAPDFDRLLARIAASGGRLHAFQAKELLRHLLEAGRRPPEVGVDPGVVAYLLEQGSGGADLSDLAGRYLGWSTGASGPARLLEEDGEEEVAQRALAVARLSTVLPERLRAEGEERLYEEIERPLIEILARMEVVGVGVDVDYLRRLNEELTAEAHRLEEQVQAEAGVRFNVNSTPQLREVLFERLGLPPQRRTKTGYSTDAASLERLRGTHPVVDALLAYREVEKLRSTYGEGLLAEVGPDGRIHATFQQTVARTGRLSSDHPNLHNIPVRSEIGARFRRAFVPAAGFRLLVADYDQIELRVIAHLANDPGLLEAFRSGEDVHAATAARIFGVPREEVTPAQRTRAKTVSYGLAYGMEAYGLAQRLRISREEAEEILEAYFRAFPNVRRYMEETVATARARGYTETLLGRRRAIPELTSPDRRLRLAGERQAMNAGIQGLAADIFKLALVRLDRALAGHRSRLVLQVHDEVLVEVALGEEDEVTDLVRRVMTGAIELSAPLAVHIAVADSWGAAKS